MTPASTADPLDLELAGLDSSAARLTPTVSDRLSELVAKLEDDATRGSVVDVLKKATPRQRSRRIRWTIIGVIAALVAGVGAAPATAAVERWLAHTGQFGPKTTESDTSEWIGLNAPDSNKALAALYPSYLVLPPTVTKNDVIRIMLIRNSASVKSGNPEGGHVVEQVTGVHESYEFIAICAWYGDWLAADDVVDKSRLAAATAGLQTAANFPAIASASPSITVRLQRFAAGAAAGDRASVEEGYKEPGCSNFGEGFGR
jgi:hypothetical protein